MNEMMFKRILAIALSAVIMMNASAPAFAAETEVIEAEVQEEEVEEETLQEETGVEVEESEDILASDTFEVLEEVNEDVPSANLIEEDLNQDDNAVPKDTEQENVELSVSENITTELDNNASMTQNQDATATSVGNTGEYVASGKCGENITWTLDENGILEITGSGDMPPGDYFFEYNSEIKKVVVGEGITSVHINSKKDSNSYRYITEISLPSTLTAIDDYAFCGLDKLTSISLPSGLESIGTYAFAYVGITEINLPGSISNIGERVFFQSYLTKLVLSEGIKYVPEYAFFGNRKLENVVFPNSLETIGTHAFVGCENLKSIEIPENVSEIGDWAFGQCYLLESVNIPSKIKVIGSYTFGHCYALKDVILPDGLTEIKDSGFRNCRSFENIVIPGTVTTISESAFQGCKSLKTVEILEGVKNIDNQAFLGCSKLENIIIPKSVTFIGTDVFYEKYIPIPELLTINCYYGSTAYKYANTNSITSHVYGYQIAYHDTEKLSKKPVVIDCYYDKPHKLISTIAFIQFLRNDYGISVSNDFQYIYEIERWSTIPSGSGGENYFVGDTILLESGEDGAIINLYTNWTEIKYYINYHLDGGINAPNNPEYCTANGYVIRLNDPQKEYYTFAGWYIDKNCGNGPYTQITSVPYNIINNLYAKWIPVEYGIEYELNGGIFNGSAKTSYNVEDDVIELLEPSRSGYAFGGWYNNAQFTGNVIYEIPAGSNGDRTFYAKWEKVDYTITYQLNGGKNHVDNPSGFDVNASVELKNPSREGYTFAGWYNNAEFTGDSVNAIPIGTTENVVLHAKWIPVNYTISYQLNGGQNHQNNPATYTINDFVTLQDASRPGYIFEGWFEDAEYTSAQIETIAVGSKENIVLYAKWSAIEYTINYELNGGVNHSNNPIMYKIVDEVQLYNPTCVGYAFVGWYDNAQFDGSKIEKLSVGSMGNITLYAKWDIVKYNITYHLNEGVNPETNPNAYDILSGEIQLSDPEREGHVFKGWYTDETLNGDPIVSIDPLTLSDVNVYASWELEEYLIEYVLNEGENNINNAEKYTINDAILLEEPTRLGYTFKGWYENEDLTGTAVTEIVAGTVGNKVFYANWEVIQYNITYNLYNGINAQNNPLTYSILDEKIILENPTRERYIFEGWFNNAEFTGEPVEYIMGASLCDVELYAKWKNGINAELNLQNNQVIYSYSIDEWDDEWDAEFHWQTEKYLSVDIKIDPNEYYLDEDDFRYYIANENGEIIFNRYCYYHAISIGVLKSGNYKIYATYEEYDLTTNVVDFTVSYDRREYPVNKNLSWIKDINPNNPLTFKDIYTEIESDLLDGIENRISAKVSEEVSTGKILLKDTDGITIKDHSPVKSGTYKVIYTLDNVGDTFKETAEATIFICYEPAAASDELVGHCGENIEWKLDANGVLHIYGYGSMNYNFKFAEYLNPAMVKTIKMYGDIQTISSYAFYNFYNLVDVQFADSIREIGYNAFELCTLLKKVTLPKKLETIESNAFKKCIALEECILTDGLKEVGRSAFADCKKLSSISLPDSITNLSWGIFYGCTSLKSVKLPNNIKTIGSSMFSGCTNLKNVTLPNSVNSIEANAFSGCSSLTEMTIPEKVTVLNSGIFSECTNLAKIKIPEGIQVIEYGVFRDCKKLGSITLPSTVIEIGSSAFNGCTSLKQIIIPDKVRNISQMMFYGCSNLSKVVFPKGLESIGYYAFDGCSSLKEINLPDGLKSIDGSCFSDINAIIYVPKTVNSIGQYAFGYGHKNYEDNSVIKCYKNSYAHKYAIEHDISFYLIDAGKETTYTITYKLNKGTNASANPKSYKSTDKTFTIKDPKRTGYTFLGWYEDSKFYRSADTTIVQGSMGNKVFYAKWAKTYSITYVLNGGKNNSSNPKTYHTESYVELKNPTKKGYAFKGWYSDSNYKTKVKTIGGWQQKNIKLYAKWEKTKYTVKYTLNGGKNSTKNPKTYYVTTSSITLKNPTRTGYTFKGWYSDSNYKTKVTQIAKGSTGNKKLYAKWEAKKYTITYYLNNGKNNSSNPKSYTIATSTISLKNPTRTGYTFKGWYSDSKFKTKVTKIGKGSTGNKKLYAKWEVNKYNIKFNGNGAQSGTMKTVSGVKYTSKYTLPINKYEKNFNSFVGWNTKKDGSGVTYREKSSVQKLTATNGATVTLYAQWKPICTIDNYAQQGKEYSVFVYL